MKNNLRVSGPYRNRGCEFWHLRDKMGRLIVSYNTTKQMIRLADKGEKFFTPATNHQRRIVENLINRPRFSCVWHERPQIWKPMNKSCV